MTRSYSGSAFVLVACVFAACLTACGPPNNPATNADSRGAVAVAYAFLEAIGRADTVTLKLHSVEDARLVALAQDPSMEPRITPRDDFLLQVQADSGRFEERMWSAEVHVEGRIATVWAPYDFHIDGQFSHCGIDTFGLVKMARDWKIFSVAYTVVREDCPESPMGPVGA